MMNPLSHPPGNFDYPESRAGRIAVALIATALSGAGFSAGLLLIATAMLPNATAFPTGWLAVPMVALAFCGVAAIIAASVAMVVEHERSAFVALALLAGLLMTFAAIYGP
jgi:hypothetical protein